MHRRPHDVTVVHHMLVTQRVELEVWPATAEVYFQDERHVDAINTQVRFEAAVYNAASSEVIWSVHDVAGGPGAGVIDPSGLYVAPPKGGLSTGTTDIVVATAVADPTRKASARVSLVGFGPWPPPVPRVVIFPEQAYLYYRTSVHNAYMDVSNMEQLFRADVFGGDAEDVQWYAGSEGSVTWQAQGAWYKYKPTEGTGMSGRVRVVKGVLPGNPDVSDEARVVLINYWWPGLE